MERTPRRSIFNAADRGDRPHIAVYPNANEVIVGTLDEVYSRRRLINRTTVTAAKIGDQIFGILERRLAAIRAALGKLGAIYEVRYWH